MSSADNAQKVAFARSQNEFAEKKARDALQLTGKSLPCSVVSVKGWIVTVKFEVDTSPFTLPQITVPVASPQFDYLPLRVGDPGVVRAADARVSAIAGLGGGTAKLGLPANLAALVFEPIGNAGWEVPSDADVRVVQGPGGVLVQTMDGDATVLIKSDAITMTRGGGSVTIKDGEVDIVGTLKINGKAYLSHEHSGVQAGGSNSGGVVDP